MPLGGRSYPMAGIDTPISYHHEPDFVVDVEISDKSSRATNPLGEPLNIVNVIVNNRVDISSPSRRF